MCSSDLLLLWGESLGTGIAIRLASQHPVAAVLLEQPYTSIADVAQTKYPFVPARPLVKDKFEALAYVPKIAAPVFVMHGDADRLVPFAMGRAIAETGKAELWIAKGAGHVDLSQFGAVEAAADFVQRRCR